MLPLNGIIITGIDGNQGFTVSDENRVQVQRCSTP